MWTFGVNTPFELLQKSNEFTLKGIANMIGCPTLDLEAQDDESFLGQPKMICDALICTNMSNLLQGRVSRVTIMLLPYL
jgi:hypothetical protein